VLPRMSEIVAYIERERGLYLTDAVDVWRGVPHPRPNLRRTLAALKAIAISSWQRRLNPTATQISRVRSLVEV
jgi:hypothetical protein